MADENKSTDVSAPETSSSITPELETNVGSEQSQGQPKTDKLYESTVIPFETENSEQNVNPEELNLEGQHRVEQHENTVAIDETEKNSEQDVTRPESGQLSLDEHSKVEQRDENTVTGHETEKVSDEELAEDEKHGGINVDDSIHRGTNVDNEVHEGIDEDVVDVKESSNVNISEGHLGIVRDQDDIRDEVGECDVDVQSDEHEVSQRDNERPTSTTDTVVQDEATIDTRVQNEANIDSRELEGKFEEGRYDDNERQDRSFEAPGEVSNDTRERMEEMEDRTEDVVIGEQSVYGEDLGSQEKRVHTKAFALKPAAQSEVVRGDKGASLSATPQEAHFSQSQVSSMAEQSQPESIMQGRNLYGHIHNIFGKQQGEAFIELYRNVAFQNKKKM